MKTQVEIQREVVWAVEQLQAATTAVPQQEDVIVKWTAYLDALCWTLRPGLWTGRD